MGAGFATSGLALAVASAYSYSEAQRLNDNYNEKEDEDRAEKLKKDGQKYKTNGYIFGFGGASIACFASSAMLFYLHYSSLEPTRLFDRFSIAPFVTEDL